MVARCLWVSMKSARLFLVSWEYNVQLLLKRSNQLSKCKHILNIVNKITKPFVLYFISGCAWLLFICWIVI